MTTDDRYEGLDPLMAVLTDTPPPEAARGDTGFMAEHAAAAADVALLREQLGIIGERLAERPPAVVPVPLPVPRSRRAWKVAFLGLAAVCAMCCVALLVWLGSDDGTASRHHGDADLSPEGYVACSRLIVEGTVERVDPVPGGAQDRITLRAARYYKPDRGAREVVFVMDRDVDPRLRVGDRTLITIPKGEASPDGWTTGADLAHARTMIVKALPGSRGVRC